MFPVRRHTVYLSGEDGFKLFVDTEADLSPALAVEVGSSKEYDGVQEKLFVL